MADCSKADVMHQNIDLALADTLQFHVNHEQGLIQSDDPEIYLSDRGITMDPSIRYFTLRWNGRQIPACVHRHSRSFGKNDRGQWISEVHWVIQHIGHEDYALQSPARRYEFRGPQELACATYLFLKALSAYGGLFNRPQWNFFPEYRKITAALSNGHKRRIYGGLN